MSCSSTSRECLRDSSREADIPARYGGEEMALILPHTDLEGAYAIAERIRTSIEALRIPRLDRQGTLRSPRASASPPPSDGDKDALIADADGALYAAKRQGKNRTIRPSRRPRTCSAASRLYPMGLLDDAIREHLDLKRRRGADPAEVERAEREALGPVRRGPEVRRGGGAGAETRSRNRSPTTTKKNHRAGKSRFRTSAMASSPTETPAEPALSTWAMSLSPQPCRQRTLRQSRLIFGPTRSPALPRNRRTIRRARTCGATRGGSRRACRAIEHEPLEPPPPEPPDHPGAETAEYEVEAAFEEEVQERGVPRTFSRRRQISLQDTPAPIACGSSSARPGTSISTAEATSRSRIPVSVGSTHGLVRSSRLLTFPSFRLSLSWVSGSCSS